MLICQKSFTTVENLGGKNALWGHTKYFQHLRSHSAFQRFRPVTRICCAMLSRSVMSDSSWPHGLFCPWGVSRQEHWSGLPCPPPRNLSNPGIKPRSPPLQADSLPAQQPPGKPMNTRMGSLSVLQGIFPTQESN